MSNFFLSIILVVVLLCHEQATAQHFYIQANAGYGLGFSRTFLGEKIDIDPTGTTPAATTRQGVYGSLGRGLVASIRAGYMIAANVSVELAGSYTIGAETERFRTMNFGSFVPEAGPESTLQAFIPAIAPSVVLCFTEKGVIPYARLGAYIAFPTMNLREEKYMNPYVDDGIVKEAATKVYTGGISIGMQYGVGVRIPLADNISLATEAWMVAASWGPEQLETEDGKVLVEYRESYIYQSGENGVAQQIQPRFTLSTAGISIGLCYSL